MRPSVLSDVSNRRRSPKRRQDLVSVLKRKHPSTKRIQKHKTGTIKEIHIFTGDKSTKARDHEHHGSVQEEIDAREQCLRDAFREWKGGIGKTWEEARAEEESGRQAEMHQRLHLISHFCCFPLLDATNDPEEDFSEGETFPVLDGVTVAAELLIADIDLGLEENNRDKDVNPWWLPSLE